MANAVTTNMFAQVPAIPADVAAFFEEESNVVSRQTVPSLTFTGKVWSVNVEGEKKVLTRKNAEGDDEPVSVLRVVILDWNRQRGRAYYLGTYDPDKVAMPECWSEDGIKPSEHVKDTFEDDEGRRCGRQSSVCAKCPMSAKGSRVTDNGKTAVACSEHRMIALIPATQNLDFEPLRMKIAVTSDYDGQSPEHEKQGWYAFKNYVEFLKAKGVKHTAAIVTKIKFDPNVAYPKLLFASDRWLTAEQMAIVPAVARDPKVKALISGVWTPNGGDGTKIEKTAEVEDEDGAEVAAKPAVTKAPATVAKVVDPLAKARAAKAAKKAAEDAAVAAAAEETEEQGEVVETTTVSDENEVEEVVAKPVVKVPAKPAGKPAAAKAATAPAPAAKAPAKPAAKAKTVEVEEETEEAEAAPADGEDNSLDGLLEDWG